LSRRSVALALCAALALAAGVGGLATGVERGRGLEVVVTGVSRPLQLVATGRGLLVLAAGSRGDVAGELYRIEPVRSHPVDLAGQPWLRLPFMKTGPAALGSLAARSEGEDLYLGEENGRRLWRLGADGPLVPYGTGLSRLAGGSTLAVDAGGRLLVLDHVDPRVSPPDEAWPGLEHLRDEAYEGSVLYRVALDAPVVLPRRFDRIAPLWPRGWAVPGREAPLPRFVALAPSGDDVILLDSGGQLYRLGGAGRPVAWTSLPAGQYLRVNMTAGPGGILYVSGGFWVARVFRVTPDGAVLTLAAGLADPQGLALVDGHLYVAESALHRVVRLRAG